MDIRLTLLDLPEDIWGGIFSYMSEPEAIWASMVGRRTYNALRRFYTRLLPIFDAKWQETKNLIQLSQKPSLRPWFPFLRMEKVQSALRNLNEEVFDILKAVKTIFSMLERCPLDNLRVIIFIQLVWEQKTIIFSEPHLKSSRGRIFAEMKRTGFNREDRGDNLEYLIPQGVLLFNTNISAISSGINEEYSHILQALFAFLIKRDKFMVYISWGSAAKNMVNFIETCYQSEKKNNYHIIRTAHPSPMVQSSNFVGSGQFVECNKVLEEQKLEPIAW